MDRPGLEPARHARALRGLERINAWSLSARTVATALERVRARAGAAPLRVLDVASGAGDVAIGVWSRSRGGVPAFELVGSDVNPVAVEFARRRARAAGAPVEFVVLDACRGELPAGFDVVTCSLFLHHLDEEEVVDYLRRAARAARRAVLVDDLDRSRAGLLLARVATRFLSSSDVVHVDGPRSVEGAFTPEEARALAARAGLAGARVRTRWPSRWVLEWSAP